MLQKYTFFLTISYTYYINPLSIIENFYHIIQKIMLILLLFIPLFHLWDFCFCSTIYGMYRTLDGSYANIHLLKCGFSGDFTPIWHSDDVKIDVYDLHSDLLNIY